MKRHDYKESSGHVFADLGVNAPQEALAKAELTARIAQICEARAHAGRGRQGARR